MLKNRAEKLIRHFFESFFLISFKTKVLNFGFSEVLSAATAPIQSELYE